VTDAWHCRWCGQAFVITDLTTDHEKRCDHRPRESK